MLKASKYDARSCAPVEAMKCGTVTVRSIQRGDDDLIDGYNSWVCGYDFNELLDECRSVIYAFQNQTPIWDVVNFGATEYAAKELSWEIRIDEIEKILLNG
jgi:glycosyltransferase involved in cell wall biosynthesis